MAYNLQPLITILQQILNPEQKQWILDDHNKPQLESLLKKAVSLKQIHEKSPVPKVESLESQIRDAAHEAEDIIESHMVDQVLSRPGGVKFTFSTADDDLQKVMQELDSAMEQVVKLVEGETISTGGSSSGDSFLADPLNGASTSKSVMVGVDEDLMQLKDRLTGMQSQQLEIIPIVGMGGIGKTTLARKLYNDPLIVSGHFDSRAWITISQDYNVRSVLLGLLDCIIGKQHSELIEHKDNELKDVLYKNLYERRYLIVLDDMWSTKSWNDIRRCFPDCNNGSRIMITTRESYVAKYADSQSVQHQMQLLKEDESWNLLHQTVFGEEMNFLGALQGVGRKIARDCGGLPLAINVIGGLLCNAKRSRDAWEKISTDVRAAIAEAGDQFSNILSLSYNHLPDELRPCFLYMGAFPEDYEIKASRLVRLWVAEGILKPNGEKSLEEEEAEQNLKALVERNLLLVIRKKSNGKALSYGMHDLLRDVCIRKADEEKFVHVKNDRVEKVRSQRLRRVSAHTSYRMRDMYASAEFMSLARSFLCIGLMSHAILSPIFFELRLLRVLDVMGMQFPKFPREILELVNLRYLALFCNSNLPSEISRLWNLQTFIARLKNDWLCVPSEIWDMSALRHLVFKYTNIFIEKGYRKMFVQKKLQTMSTVELNDLIDSGFFGCIPSIKNLGLKCVDSPRYTEADLRHLHKLETLKCLSNLSHDEARSFVDTLLLPSSVRKLSLRGCAISQKLLTTLRAMPNLEVLKLCKCVFDDEEWDAATQGEAFGSLQFLQLESLNLVRWRADETNFPRLQQLVIRGCSELEEIPGGIGEITTLQLIELHKCSPSAVASAKQIQEEQQTEFDNYDLQLSIS